MIPSMRVGSRRGALLAGALALVLLPALGGCVSGRSESLAAMGKHMPAQPDCRAATLTADGKAAALPADGCWNAANLARMVADPRDLAQGKPLSPANGAREALVIDAYQRGQTKPLTQGATRPTLTIGAAPDTGGQ